MTTARNNKNQMSKAYLDFFNLLMKDDIRIIVGCVSEILMCNYT